MQGPSIQQAVNGSEDGVIRRRVLFAKTYFQLERIGMPSRWNTLRALRVLKWWNRAETAGE
jgi:hypothetical protein